jgi:hypothetical protein
MVLSLNNGNGMDMNTEGNEQTLLSPGLMSAVLGLSIPSSKGMSIPTSSDRSLKKRKKRRKSSRPYFL